MRNFTAPIITETLRRPEPVGHDTFIDDLRGAPAHPQSPRERQRG
jgi:hypothetical protein